MTDLAPFEYVSLVDAHGNAGFTEQEPPPRVWTDAEMQIVREQAEAAGHARAQASIEARVAVALETLAAQSRDLRGEMAGIEKQIVRDAANLARILANRIAGQALHNDPLAVVDPVIETTLTQATGPHRLHITVHEILKPAIVSRVNELAERIGFEGGICVSSGADHMSDCRIEWATGGIARDHRALVAEIDLCMEAHGYPAEAIHDRRAGPAEEDNLQFDFDDTDNEPRPPTGPGA